jgi:UDP-N-acetylglucosamine 2-epimerase (non-hydrolysing)
MKIISVVGARPNFIKIAPFVKAINAFNDLSIHKIDHLLVHTGQHYDNRMSDAFFRQLEIPEADINLSIGSGSHAEQVGNTMICFEKVLRKEKPDWVVVVGDVNATLACSITAKKVWINCCHIEAGLRSGDMHMPEEINRLVTDRISDLLLTPDEISCQNLKKEGVHKSRIKMVGNIMIDTLEKYQHKAGYIRISDIIKNNLYSEGGLPVMFSESERYAVITLHRPSNVDSKEIMVNLLDFITEEVLKDLILIWPVHPRTKKQLVEFGLWKKLVNRVRLILLKPVSYLEMLRLNMGAKLILTDSGGIQEECTVLGTPCLTLRWNTERPITLRENGGVCVLVGNDINKLRNEYHLSFTMGRNSSKPDFWDGHTAERCLKEILNFK